MQFNVGMCQLHVTEATHSFGFFVMTRRPQPILLDKMHDIMLRSLFILYAKTRVATTNIYRRYKGITITL